MTRELLPPFKPQQPRPTFARSFVNRGHAWPDSPFRKQHRMDLSVRLCFDSWRGKSERGSASPAGTAGTGLGQPNLPALPGDMGTDAGERAGGRHGQEETQAATHVGIDVIEKVDFV